MQLYRVISDIHCEFWPENFAKAAKMADRLLPLVEAAADTVLLLAGSRAPTGAATSTAP